MASGVQAVTVPGVSGTVGPTAKDATTSVSYFGFSLRETAGAIAVVRIRSGGTITGTMLDTIAFAANESKNEWCGPQGISAPGGLYFEIVSGAVAGSVRVG